MDRKSCVIAIAATIYLILLGVFYKIESNEFECESFVDECVHVCSSAKELSDQAIRERIRGQPSESKVGILDWIDEDSFKIIRGGLKCLETKTIHSQDMSEELDFDEFHPAILMSLPEKYCIELLDVENKNDTLPFRMHVCSKNVVVRRIFHGIGELFHVF